MAVKGKVGSKGKVSKRAVDKSQKEEKVAEKVSKSVERKALEEEEPEEKEKDFELPSSESESESEEEEVEFAEDVEGGSTVTDVKSGHSITKSQKPSKSASSKKEKTQKGVIYVGRLPNGFEENELKKYFTQFGAITQLRLSRNKKTGKSKHYAFIEFENSKVAEIAVETMNNYLLMGHQLKCNVVNAESVNENLFVGANKRYKRVNWSKLALLKNDSKKSSEKWNQLQSQHETNQKSKQEKLKALGIDYDLADI